MTQTQSANFGGNLQICRLCVYVIRLIVNKCSFESFMCLELQKISCCFFLLISVGITCNRAAILYLELSPLAYVATVMCTQHYDNKAGWQRVLCLYCARGKVLTAVFLSPQATTLVWSSSGRQQLHLQQERQDRSTREKRRGRGELDPGQRGLIQPADKQIWSGWHWCWGRKRVRNWKKDEMHVFCVKKKKK